MLKILFFYDSWGKRLNGQCTSSSGKTGAAPNTKKINKIFDKKSIILLSTHLE